MISLVLRGSLAGRKRDRTRHDPCESRDETGASRSGRREGDHGSTARRTGGEKREWERERQGEKRAHPRDRIDRPYTSSVARGRVESIAADLPIPGIPFGGAVTMPRIRRYHQGIVEKTAKTTDSDT